MGWQVRGTSRFPDHHRYAPADVVDVIRQASGCDAVFTTEKDAVKLASLWPPSPALHCVPVTLIGIEPAVWLRLAGVGHSHCSLHPNAEVTEMSQGDA
jgi:tetraacyldisaccharide-1-P 4'-kinase